MKPNPYNFVTNNWSQERYDKDILFNSKGIHQPTGRHKTNSATEQFKEIIPHIKETKNALDIGARWGSFTVQLHKLGFEHVYMAELRETHMIGVSHNVDMKRATMYNVPIMDRHRSISTMQKSITNLNEGNTESFSIDDLEIKNVNFIKIDVDGPDRLVLRGGLKTIRKYKPVIYIEYGDEQIKWEYSHLNIKIPNKINFWFETLGDSYRSIDCKVEPNNLILIPKKI
tara:strand:+ start:159 stop:842 length:684 start_codon:yes stop_codon:yes gene_type:complete